MKKISIKSTDKTPQVFFDKELLSIIGRSFPEDPKRFYGSLIKEVKNYDGPNLSVELNFEYLNTASTKVILEMLKTLNDKCELSVLWVYEEGDDEMFDTGDFFAETLGIKFEYEVIPE